MAMLGVPYGELVRDGRAIADARTQARAIADDIASTGGPADLQDKEIVALVAYLQRLGTDIKKAGAVAQRTTLLGGF
jgi:cytochrome c oxidase cbb3-type subunit I/II